VAVESFSESQVAMGRVCLASSAILQVPGGLGSECFFSTPAASLWPLLGGLEIRQSRLPCGELSLRTLGNLKKRLLLGGNRSSCFAVMGTLLLETLPCVLMNFRNRYLNDEKVERTARTKTGCATIARDSLTAAKKASPTSQPT